MQSPTKNYPKKMNRTKSSTFSQPTAQTEVGEFKGGYFVMSSPIVNKENDTNPTNSLKRSTNLKQEHDTYSMKKSTNNMKQDRSPFPFSSSKDSNLLHFEQAGGRRHSMSSYVEPPTKMFDSPTKRTSSRDHLSTSPPTTGASTRWAGPAFGNAPPPSSLPLPDWTPVTSASPSPLLTSVSPHASYQVQHPGMTFSPLSSSPPQAYTHPLSASCSQIPPPAPFPYAHLPSPVLEPSLAQLSTDLRRLLNIGSGFDPILVSANSS